MKWLFYLLVNIGLYKLVVLITGFDESKIMWWLLMCVLADTMVAEDKSE